MKLFKSLIIYLSIFSILLYSFTPKVYADVPASQKVVKHEGANNWTYPFDYRLYNAYFTVDNSSNLIPTSSTNTPIYFYTEDNVKFYSKSGKEVYTTVLNRGVGITTGSDLLTLLWRDFCNIAATKSAQGTYYQGALYDQNGIFLGYCLNDISGCYYVDAENVDQPAVTFPNDYVNDVKNHFKYYSREIYPDYITYYPPSNEYVLSNFVPSYTDRPGVGTEEEWVNLCKSTYTSASSSYDMLLSLSKTTDYCYFPSGTVAGTSHTYLTGLNTSGDHFIYYPNSNVDYQWDNFCHQYGLIDGENELLFTELVNYVGNSTKALNWIRYDSNNNNKNTADIYWWGFSGSTPVENKTQNVNISSNLYKIGIIGGALFCPMGKSFTIYKSSDIYNDIINKNYEPDVFTDTNYKNYDTNNDNSFTISSSTVDNSVNLNQLIYENSVSSFNENISTENSTINTENISNNTTTIINNYYPTESDTPDNPDQPDNPVDDDTVLDAILAALKRFFDVIGKILGTVLAGLLEVIDSILESIAGIMDGLGGITDFIGALFSWIPTPVPQILGVGISICILAAIFKFIRG